MGVRIKSWQSHTDHHANETLVYCSAQFALAERGHRGFVWIDSRILSQSILDPESSGRIASSRTLLIFNSFFNRWWPSKIADTFFIARLWKCTVWRREIFEYSLMADTIQVFQPTRNRNNNKIMKNEKTVLILERLFTGKRNTFSVDHFSFSLFAICPTSTPSSSRCLYSLSDYFYIFLFCNIWRAKFTFYSQ